MLRKSSLHLAILSGIFSSCGGVFAKLAGFYDTTSLWSLLGKLALLGAMVTSNTIGCTLFAKVLALSGSSLPPTVVTSTVNFVCSAILGKLVFGESTTLCWWCGTALVMLGLALICYTTPAKRMETEEADRKQQ